MGDLFQPWHLIIVAGLAVLLFGGKKLPELGKGLGEGFRSFKEGLKGIDPNEDAAAEEKKKEAEVRAAAEAKAYKEAKLADEARIAAEARLAAEKKAESERVEVGR